MKLLLLKCAICDNWHSPKRHCNVCGAYHVPRIIARSCHVNKQGIEMIRAIPRPIESTINMRGEQ